MIRHWFTKSILFFHRTGIYYLDLSLLIVVTQIRGHMQALLPPHHYGSCLSFFNYYAPGTKEAITAVDHNSSQQI